MINRLLKNKWSFILIGYFAFILYGTTLPFRFSLDADVIQRNLDKLMIIFSGAPLYWKHNESDMVANILFFIPFGLFLFNRLYYKHDRELRFRSVLFITLTGFLLSSFVEAIQLFSPRRTSSFADVLANTLGTFSGALIGYHLYRRQLFHQIHHYIETKLKNPLIILMMAYVLIIIIIGLAPFNFNISPRFVSLRILHLKIIENSFLEKPVNLFSLLFLYGPGGYIFTHFFSRRLNMPSFGKPAIWALITGILLCIFVETGQFFVNSRAFSVSDIFVGILGIGYGLVTYLIFHKQQAGISSDKYDYQYFGLFIFISINYLVYVIYKYLYSFIMIPDFALLAKKIDFFLFNLLSYAPSNQVRTLLVITLKNVVLFLPLGMISRELGELFAIFSKRVIVILFITTIVLTLKTIQFLNLHQVPLLFDFFGILLGVLGGYYIWKEIREFFITGKYQADFSKPDSAPDSETI